MMSDQPYKRPPITEAIIQISFAGVMSTDDLSKVNSNFGRLYPQHHDIRNVNLAVEMPPGSGAEPRAQVQTQEEGHRRGSDDQTQLVVLWKKVAGYRRIIRTGVRYVNRIDIPITGSIIEYENYLDIYPHLPEELGSNDAYGVQVRFPISELGCSLTINSSSVPSPILNHASFIFDQDIVKELDVPQKDDDLYKLLENIHIKKNEVFEACITDRARELFRT
jgi:hypothetical protein